MSSRWKWVGSGGVSPVMSRTWLRARTASVSEVRVLVNAGPWVTEATPTRPVARDQLSAMPTELFLWTTGTNRPPRSR